MLSAPEVKPLMQTKFIQDISHIPVLDDLSDRISYYIALLGKRTDIECKDECETYVTVTLIKVQTKEKALSREPARDREMVRENG